MKKIYILFALIASAMMFASCQKDFDGIINAEIEDYVGGDDKVYIDVDNFASWHDGDEVLVNGKPCTISIENGIAKIHTDKNDAEQETYVAIYPKKYAIENRVEKKFRLPKVQIYRTKEMPNTSTKVQVVDAPMVADTLVTSDGVPTLKFKNAGALMKISVCNPTNSPITLRQILLRSVAINEGDVRASLSGDVDFSNDTYTPEQRQSSDTYTLTLSFEGEGAESVTLQGNASQTFYMAVPCVESAFEIEISYLNNNDNYNYKYTSKKTNKHKIERNTMATLTLESNNMVADPAKVLIGAGTESDPYQITSNEDFQAFIDNCNSMGSNVYVKQMEDLGRSGDVHGPRNFKGKYDGNGKTFTISNDPLVAKKFAGGVFSSLGNGAEIKNLNVSIVTNQTGGDANWSTGGVADELFGDDVVIENCHITGIINAHYVGGIIGSTKGHSVTIKNCSVENHLVGTHVGGIIGCIQNGRTGSVKIINCSVKSPWTTDNGVDGYKMFTVTKFGGGFIGLNESTQEILIENCFSTVSIIARPKSGDEGIVAYAIGKNAVSGSNLKLNNVYVWSKNNSKQKKKWIIGAGEVTPNNVYAPIANPGTPEGEDIYGCAVTTFNPTSPTWKADLVGNLNSNVTSHNTSGSESWFSWAEVGTGLYEYPVHIIPTTSTSSL